jgi:hypothetical protein
MPCRYIATMARYFFHLHDDQDVDGNDEGRELADLATAVTVATSEIRDFLADQVRHGYFDAGLRIEITDDSGQSVATVHGSEAVKLRE